MYCYKVTLKIQPPFLTETTGALRVGLDAQPLLVDKKPAIPGSLIKGHLNEILLRTDISEAKFINPTEAESAASQSSDNSEETSENTDKKRSHLHFSPDWICQEGFGFAHEQRISIDDKTGVVDTGSLVFEEVVVSDNGEPLEFSGTIYLSDIEPDEDFKGRLKRLLELIPAIGSNKKIGFGRLKGVEVEEDNTNGGNANLSSIPTGTQTLGFAIRPQWAMCFVKPHRNQIDTVSTKPYIPGSALKAALFRLVDDCENSDILKRLLDEATVTHALQTSAEGERRPVVAPLSVGFLADDSTINNPQNFLFSDPDEIENGIPVFEPDWKPKQRQKIREKYGWKDTPITLRVRHSYDVAINASKESELFIEETIAYRNNVSWLFNIHFIEPLNEAESEAVNQLIDKIQTQGLSRLGRKATPAQFVSNKIGGYNYESYESFDIPTTEKQTGIMVVHLQTSARLLNNELLKKNLPKEEAKNEEPENYLERLKKLWDKLKSKTDNDDTNTWLTACYEQAFNELVKPSSEEQSAIKLKLDKCFAKQFFQGGNRWQKHLANHNKAYQPEIFTRAGSVFVFSFNNKNRGAIKELVAEWRRLGLPQLADRSEQVFINPWTKQAPQVNQAEKDKDTLTTPWTRANGYGQVIIELSENSNE